jgi:hypothetical protein
MSESSLTATLIIRTEQACSIERVEEIMFDMQEGIEYSARGDGAVLFPSAPSNHPPPATICKKPLDIWQR